jgi:hypothetical protein
MSHRSGALRFLRAARTSIAIDAGKRLALFPVQNRKEILRMGRYGEKAQKKVEKAMSERKHGTLKSGSSGKTVTSKKQAIAIGLSEARRAGGKVPAKKSSAKKK